MDIQWLKELLQSSSSAHTVLLLCLAIFPGLWLGERSVAGVKLGIAGVLFSGLAIGALGLPSDAHTMHFVREFGLILFVFAVGLQVGPGFFASFKDQGLRLNLMALCLVVGGTAVAAVGKLVFGFPVEAAVGVLSGAVTNTPGLGAAQQALKDALGDGAAALAGSGYAVAYPFGIFGIIASMILIRRLFKVSIDDEAKAFAKARESGEGTPTSFSLHVQNPMVDGKTIGELVSLAGVPVVFSRLERGGVTRVPLDTDTLATGDQLQAVCTRGDLERITVLIGERSAEELKRKPSALAFQRMLVSKLLSAPIGGRDLVSGRVMRLGQLRLEERFQVRVTRICRSGVELVPDRDSAIHIGDILTVVGEPHQLKAVAREVGDSSAALDHPRLLSVFLGISLGVLLGSIPVAIPGLPQPVKLGLAGGPLVVALLMGFVRRVGPLTFHMNMGSNLMLREFGIILFLAAVGLSSGPAFVQAISSQDGWQWALLGAAITFLPVFTVGLVGRMKGMNYLSLSGLLAGAMTDPPALGYANSLAESPAQSVSYASVYPFTMFLRVMMAQVFVMLLV